MTLSKVESEQLRFQAERKGMPACEECEVVLGTLRDDGLIEAHPPAVPMAQADQDVPIAQVRHDWTVEVQGVFYAVGQDSRYHLIAYAPGAD